MIVLLLTSILCQQVRQDVVCVLDLASGESDTRDFALSADNDDDEGNDDDDDEQFKGVQEKEVKSHLAPKWPTRVFAVSCMMKLMQVSGTHGLK